MDKTLIGKKLQELRFSKFGKDQSMGDFEAISGVSRGSVGPIEKGMSFPRLDILQKWTTACGTTPSKFLEDLQKEIGTNQDVEIVPGFEAFYDNLTRIIRSGSQ